MPIVTSANKTPKTKSVLGEGTINQLDTVFSQTVTSKKDTEETKPKRKREYSDSVVINLPKGERNNFKSFCALNNLPMSDYIFFCMDYIRDKVQDGVLSVGKGGIKEIKKSE